MENESNFVRKEPCPECGSRDNLARYTDGHAYCFGCEYREPPTNTSPADSTQRKSARMDLIRGEFKDLVKRGIREDTCKKYNYTIAVDKDDRKVQVATYYNAEGQPCAQKLRYADKTFKFIGDTKAAVLYGQQLFRDGGKQVIITEGEIDALTVAQLFGNKWPVVSVPNGAQAAKKSLEKQIEWLEKFEKVILMFDMDEPGEKAARECAQIFSLGKAHIARLPLKDPNECLQEGRGSEVIDAAWGAKQYRPDGVTDVAAHIDAAMAPIEWGMTYPWDTLTKGTYGIRESELIGIGAGTGCGKSDKAKDIALHLMQKYRIKVGMLMLEEPPRITLKTMAGKIDGIRYHVPGTEYDPDKLRKTLDSLYDSLYLYDHFGSLEWNRVKECIRYMARACGVKVIFLDNLTALTAAAEDDKKALDTIMSDLGSMVQELKITVFFVSHLATPEGKSHEEGGRVLEKHFRGSRAIAFWSNFLFGLERDKQDTDGVTTFRVLKDRYTGDANGLTFGLRYDKNTGRSVEVPLPTKSDKPRRAAEGFNDESKDEF